MERWNDGTMERWIGGLMDWLSFGQLKPSAEEKAEGRATPSGSFRRLPAPSEHLLKTNAENRTTQERPTRGF